MHMISLHQIIPKYKFLQSNSMQKNKNKSIVITNAVAVKQYAIFQQSNPKFRSYMEDTSFIKDCFLDNHPKSLCFGIFDGHGGAQVSLYLEKNMADCVKQHYKKYKKSMKDTLEKSFVSMDKQLNSSIQKAQQTGATGTIGLIMLEQAKRVLYIANVGDSTAYIFDDNSGQKLTVDHRGDNYNEVDRIKKQGGKLVNNRICGVLAVTRAFGDFSLKQHGLTVIPDIKKVQIRLSHKYLVIASDGIWDYVNPTEVFKTLKNQLQPYQICKKVTKIALQKGSTDNITMMVLKL